MNMICKYCDTSFAKTTMGAELIKGAKATDDFLYCSQECYDTAWQLCSAIYEYCKHDTQKTWQEFKEAVWGEKNE